MTNYKNPGVVMSYTAPSGGVVSGTAYKIGQQLVVAAADADEDEVFQGQACGVFELPKTTGTAWTEGAVLYWNDTTKKLITTASGNLRVGCAAAAAASGDATGLARLDGVPMADES